VDNSMEEAQEAMWLVIVPPDVWSL